jgi:2-polyprenyl-3-methyl-5-hydroxy-6-metoxy-1,4-benzoquinol methylase
MSVFSSEVSSVELVADNPVHQRQLRAYVEAKNFVNGDLLEVGCGEGRGVDTLSAHINSYSAIDKTTSVQSIIIAKYPKAVFYNIHIPPFAGIEDNSFDSIVSFQVIEHIQDDLAYLKEIYRVLKPGGIAMISTPNIKKTLTRNPWHIREVFSNVDFKGIDGSARFYQYYDQNKKSVAKYKRFDIFGLENKLPLWLYQIPYDILNRINRNKLQQSNTGLVAEIDLSDFYLSDNVEEVLDFFVLLYK